jgi:uncharacterized protein YceH (UPF0502 family)
MRARVLQEEERLNMLAAGAEKRAEVEALREEVRQLKERLERMEGVGEEGGIKEE